MTTKLTFPLLVLLWLAIAVGHSLAQNEDEEIAKLEETYSAELVEIRKGLGAKWLAALSNLREELTAAAKITDASLVLKEEKRVTDLLATSPLKEANQTNIAITLPASEATTSGAIERLADNTSIALSSPGASASWDLPADLTPGEYEIILHYSSPENGGGTYKLKAGEEPELQGNILPNQTGDTTALAGKLALKQPPGKLTITSVNHLGTALLNLNRIELAPPGTWEKTQAQ